MTLSESPPDVPVENPNAVELSTSEYHDVLADERRRVTIDFFAQRPTAVVLDDLAEAVASRAGRTDEPDGDAADHVAIDLHHVHLPKLDDLGVVDYDPESGRAVPVTAAVDALAAAGRDH